MAGQIRRVPSSVAVQGSMLVGAANRGRWFAGAGACCCCAMRPRKMHCWIRYASSADANSHTLPSQVNQPCTPLISCPKWHTPTHIAQRTRRRDCMRCCRRLRPHAGAALRGSGCLVLWRQERLHSSLVTRFQGNV